MRASQCTLFLMCPTAYRRVCGTTHLATGLAAKFSWLHARTSALIREAPQRHTACASSQSNSEGSQLAARREADLRNPPPRRADLTSTLDPMKPRRCRWHPGRDELAELRPPGGSGRVEDLARGNGLWAASSPGPRRQDATGGGCGPPFRLWAY